MRGNNVSNSCGSKTNLKDKITSLPLTVLGVMLPSWDSKEQQGNKTRPRYSKHALQIRLCVWLQAHTDTVIVMQFLYSSGPRALCAALNQLRWFSGGPSTGGKQETNVMFKDRKHVQMEQFSHGLILQLHHEKNCSQRIYHSYSVCALSVLTCKYKFCSTLLHGP